MEQYLDAKVKRFVQNSHIPKTKTILAHPEKYMEYHKQVILVDPVNSSIRRNSLIGEFDLVTSQPAHHSPITFVDCDNQSYLAEMTNRYVPEMKRRQYIKELNPALYIYRDSGDNMISGLIKL